MAKVMMVGSAEQSSGGISTVIKLIKKMPVWDKYGCYWLETQIQANKFLKAKYAIKAYLKAFCKIWNYDIIHFHTVPSMSSLMVQLPIMCLALIGKKRVITHIHVGNQLSNYKKSKLFLWWLKHSDCIVLLANCFKTIFKEEYPLIKTPIEIIYNACDEVDGLSYEYHDKTILFAGAFRPNKGGVTLIKAFSQIHENYPDWKLQMLGSGPEEDLYRTLVEENNLTQAVEFPGYITGDNLSVYYKKAGIYCLCSHHEGFPMVVLEAWAYGVPVITTPVGGLPDVLIEDENCLTFDYGNENMLAKQLIRIIADFKKRMEMSQISKTFCPKHFGLKEVDKSIDNLYVQILKHK